MKTPRLITLLALSALVPQLSTPAQAQGSLTPPPGVPGPTMRSLQEIYDKAAAVETQGAATQTAVNALRGDARTPITTVPSTISAPGSYYLTGNLAVTAGTAITISADNVTLDLNGFTISSTASPVSGAGVVINGIRKNIRVTNGSIVGTTTVASGVFTTGGFSFGLQCNNPAARGIHITNLHVSNVGNVGITAGSHNTVGNIVEHCTAKICVSNGIEAHTIRTSAASDCGDQALRGTLVSDSTGVCIGTGNLDDGINAQTVSNCTGIANAGNGINAATVHGSHGTSTGGRGIVAVCASGCVGISTGSNGVEADSVTNCKGTSTSGYGIAATQAVSDSAGVSSNGYGIRCSGNVSNSSGVSAGQPGLFCEGNVTNSYGESTSGNPGIQALGTASFCRGKRDGFIAINAPITIGCTVSGTGTIASAQKHLGTP